MKGPMKYNKLVRDKIPGIITASGRQVKTHTVDGDEYFEKLKEKLVEESSEYLLSNEPEELADVFEIVYAILELKGITKEQIEEMRARKVEEKGAFKQKIILDEIE